MHVTDLLHTPISRGCFVAYATRRGSNTWLNVMQVKTAYSDVVIGTRIEGEGRKGGVARVHPKNCVILETPRLALASLNPAEVAKCF